MSSPNDKMTERIAGRRQGDRIVGSSAAIERVVEQAKVAARSELPVLTVGSSGTGRRFVARAIHTWSTNEPGAFIVLSCAALPPALQARELFGCSAGVYALVPGAYTGALSRAGSGTVFLAEIDCIRPAVRTALQKVLVERVFRAEGDSREQRLRARVMGSCEKQPDTPPFGDLPVHEIHMPPLAERPEDILPLAAHFLAELASESGLRPGGFTAEARHALLGETWPGQVRELRERVRHAGRLAGSGPVTAEALMLATESELLSFKEAKRAFETRYVEGLLRRCGGNISRAARLAKKDRKDFYDVIRRTGVDPAEFR